MKEVIYYRCEGCGAEWSSPKSCAECEDSHNHVPAWAAIRALQNGKTVIWKIKNDKLVFRPNGAWFITKTNIDFGKWYIKEDE